MPVHVFKCGYANTYLVEDGDFFAAVDVGTFAAAEKIYEYLRSRSADTSSLRMVTATHFHIDHIGGVSKLIRLFPEARAFFYVKVGDYIIRKDKICLFSFFNWIKELLPILNACDNHRNNMPAAMKSDWAAIPVPLLRKHLLSLHKVYCTLDEGSMPYLANWKLIKTPGHTNDSICLYNRREHALITGDTILNMEGSGELNKFCCDCDSIKLSFQVLSGLKIKKIYPGHGDPLLDIDGIDDVLK